MKSRLKVLWLLPWLVMSVWANAPHHHEPHAPGSTPVYNSSSAVKSTPLVAASFEGDDGCALCEWLAVATACALGVALAWILRRGRQSFAARFGRTVFHVLPRRTSRGPPIVAFA